MLTVDWFWNWTCNLVIISFLFFICDVLCDPLVSMIFNVHDRKVLLWTVNLWYSGGFPCPSTKSWKILIVPPALYRRRDIQCTGIKHLIYQFLYLRYTLLKVLQPVDVSCYESAMSILSHSDWKCVTLLYGFWRIDKSSLKNKKIKHFENILFIWMFLV